MNRSRQLAILALSASLLALSGCAGMSHRHPAGDAATAGPMGGMHGMHGMQAMHERIMNAKTTEERQALMAQHMKDMPGQCAEMMGPGGNAPPK
ncbi:hypothetical protein HZ992_20245 [Rhizobacter sp. AJA081-3]|jgi:hypothetical protein|uniref:hypothetical protein n=1 Tax=Rhizobacter sp. AJA081-3 TaxID=2753607 RepID=UPI001ADED2E6|nr:hypothetical protein [Rhizobacter sp. AJA081-3]QTN22458.1 hypothetical protein HZ992_20245 [Rhizobacter sp. AJA081-3]